MSLPNSSGRAFALPEVPRVLWVAAWVALAVGITITFVGGWVTGVTYDEPYHVLRLQHWFDYGWFLLADDLVDGQPGDWVHDRAVYAPVATLFLHGLNIVAGNDSPGQVSFSAQAYAVRHIGVALLSLPAVVAVIGIVRVGFGSWRWGVVGAGLLMAIPLWPGHAMMNMKDAPVATGYTMVTLAAALVVCRPEDRGSRRVAAAALLFAGCFLAIGTRPGIWPGLAAAVGLACLWSLVNGRAARRRLVELVVVPVSVWLALAALYPQVFASGWWLWDSVTSSADYSGVKASRALLLISVIRDVPTLMLLLGVVGLVVFARRVGLRAYRTPAGVVMVLVLAQSLLIPLLAAMNGSGLHGLRQLLFATPTVALLLMFGLARGFGRSTEADAGKQPHPVHPVMAGVAAIALLAPVAGQMLLFPHLHTYVSVVADHPGLKAGTDHWRSSIRELEREVPNGTFVICTPVVAEDGTVWRHSIGGGRSLVESSRDCRTDDLSPLRPYRTVEAGLDAEPVSTTFVAILTVPPPGEEPTNCQLLGDTDRWRNGFVRTLAQVYACDLVLRDHPRGGFELDGEGSHSEYLMGGWTGTPSEPWVHLLDRRGDLGFAWPEKQKHRYTLTLEADVTQPAAVWVNNRRVGELVPGRAEHDFDVTRGRSALDDVGVVVTLRSGAPGDVALRRVRMTTRAS